MSSPYNAGQKYDPGQRGKFSGMLGSVNWSTSLLAGDSDSQMRIIPPKLSPIGQGKRSDQRRRQNQGFSV